MLFQAAARDSGLVDTSEWMMFDIYLRMSSFVLCRILACTIAAVSDGYWLPLLD